MARARLTRRLGITSIDASVTESGDSPVGYVDYASGTTLRGWIRQDALGDGRVVGAWRGVEQEMRLNIDQSAVDDANEGVLRFSLRAGSWMGGIFPDPAQLDIRLGGRPVRMTPEVLAWAADLPVIMGGDLLSIDLPTARVGKPCASPALLEVGGFRIVVEPRHDDSAAVIRIPPGLGLMFQDFVLDDLRDAESELAAGFLSQAQGSARRMVNGEIKRLRRLESSLVSLLTSIAHGLGWRVLSIEELREVDAYIRAILEVVIDQSVSLIPAAGADESEWRAIGGALRVLEMLYDSAATPASLEALSDGIVASIGVPSFAPGAEVEQFEGSDLMSRLKRNAHKWDHPLNRLTEPARVLANPVSWRRPVEFLLSDSNTPTAQLQTSETIPLWSAPCADLLDTFARTEWMTRGSKVRESTGGIDKLDLSAAFSGIEARSREILAEATLKAQLWANPFQVLEVDHLLLERLVTWNAVGAQDTELQRHVGQIANEDAPDACRACREATGRPLISVVIPTRNRRDTVAEAINSVLGQCVGSLEVVVIDDGSSDETERVLAEFTDERVRWERTPPLGVAHARNRGVSLARGEFIAFLDSDNIMLPGFLHAAVEELGDDGWLYARFALVRADRVDVVGEPYDGERLHVTNFIDQNTLLVKTELLRLVGGFDEELRRAVDYDLVLKLASARQPRYLPRIAALGRGSGPGQVRISLSEPASWTQHVQSRYRQSPAVVNSARSLSLVIPTMRDIERVERLLVELRPLMEDGHQVILVNDGHPPEDWSRLVASWEPWGLNTCSTFGNAGFAVACNTGADLADANVVLFLNDDVRTSASEILASYSEYVEDCDGIGQILSLRNDATLDIEVAGVAFPQSGLPYAFCGGVQADPFVADALRDLRFQAVSGVALFVSLAKFRSLGGFDPLFRNGMEDIDLCLRYSETYGGAHRVLVDAPVSHRGTGSGGERTRYISQNRRLLMARWNGKWDVDDERLWAALGLRLVGYRVDDNRQMYPTPMPQLLPATR